MFYNATRQGQTWWIASFHYCHLKNYSLEEESEEVDGGMGSVRGIWQVKKVRRWESWFIECQINCPSLSPRPAIPTVLHSSLLAFQDLLYVSFFFLNCKAIITVTKYWSRRDSLKKMRGGRERKRRQKLSRERGHCKSRHLTRGGGPLIITDTLHYPCRNVCTDIFVCMCVLVCNDRRV